MTEIKSSESRVSKKKQRNNERVCKIAKRQEYLCNTCSLPLILSKKEKIEGKKNTSHA